MLEQRYFSTGNEPRFKIIMVGDCNVGKTALFWKYMEGQFLANKSESVTIIDFKIREVQIQGKPIKLYIWDTAGQQKYRSMVGSYFNGCQGVMLVFDLTKPQTFVNATTKWYEIARAKCPDAVIMLVGNKRDLPAVVQDQTAENWARQRQIQYISTSVKDDVNVNQSYQRLSQSIYRRPLTQKSQSFSLNKRDVPPAKKACC